jgi:hypothetical protein
LPNSVQQIHPKFLAGLAQLPRHLGQSPRSNIFNLLKKSQKLGVNVMREIGAQSRQLGTGLQPLVKAFLKAQNLGVKR